MWGSSSQVTHLEVGQTTISFSKKRERNSVVSFTAVSKFPGPSFVLFFNAMFEWHDFSTMSRKSEQDLDFFLAASY